jgi:membrane protease YdiL (CAAX protease family)
VVSPPRSRLVSWLVHLFVAGVWILTFRLLADHGVRLLPLALARQLTLQNYLTIVQLVTAAFGLGVSFLLLTEPREALGLVSTSPKRIGIVLLLAPLVFALSVRTAFLAAKPTLLIELAERGREAVQKSTGQFGQELVSGGLFGAILWGVIVSPIGEELLFRGALYSLAQRAIAGLTKQGEKAEAPPPASTDLAPEMLQKSFAFEVMGSLGRFAREGLGPTVFTAGIFTLMHLDTPGGMGIARWVSALCLGLATGVARHATGSVYGPIALHMAFNFYSIAATRRWIITESFPMKDGAPTLLLWVGAVSAVLAVVWALIGRRRVVS